MAVSFKKYTYRYLSSGTSHSFVDIKLSAFVFPLNRVVIFLVWALNRISYLSHTWIGSRLKTLVGDTHLSEIYGSAPGLKDSHTMLPSKDSVLKFYILCVFFHSWKDVCKWIRSFSWQCWSASHPRNCLWTIYQLSHIMRESHACRLKTLISHTRWIVLKHTIISISRKNSKKVISAEVLKGCRNIFWHFWQCS